MKLNHMICPTCGHDFYTDCEYATCSSCSTFFYVSQSKTRKLTTEDKQFGECIIQHSNLMNAVWSSKKKT